MIIIFVLCMKHVKIKLHKEDYLQLKKLNKLKRKKIVISAFIQ